MKSNRYILLLALAGPLTLLQSCIKEPLAIPPSVSEFTANSPGTFFITNTANASFKVPVGITAVADVERTINYTVSSPTGAVAGKQYSIAKSSVTIPAGVVTDSIVVNGSFAEYSNSRIDTLVFTLTAGGSVQPSTFANTYKLVLQRYCAVSLPALAGTYRKSFDIDDSDPTAPYGPYDIDVTSGTTTGTKGYILLDNLWDVGSASIRVDLDWTDVNTFKTSIPDQFLYVDSRYGNARVRGVGTGTFSACDNKLTLRYQVYVSLGSFGTFTTTISK